MDYEIVRRENFVLCGITARVSNSEPAKIGELWNRFYAEPFLEQLEVEDGAVYSAYFDYESDHSGLYSVLLGFRVPETRIAPAGLRVLTIQLGSYALLRREGPMPASVVETWKEVWNSDLKRAYVTDFDRYAAADTVEVNVGIV